MNIEEARAVIRKIEAGNAPSLKDIKDAYDAIYEKCGVHAQPLRTHIHGDGGLVIGPALGARLSAYDLKCSTAAAAAAAPPAPPRVFRI